MIMEDFNKPKIIFQEIVQSSQFMYDETIHFMCNDTGRIIVGSHLPFVLGILNSKLFFYAVKRNVVRHRLTEAGGPDYIHEMQLDAEERALADTAD